MKNSYKKKDAQGNPLSETIGKGLDKVHAQKVLNERNKFISIRVSKMEKEMFIMSCKALNLNQSDVLNMAIKKTILKASEL